MKTTIIEFFKRNLKTIKYAILVVLAIEIIWLTILVATKKPQMPPQDKATLDSLTIKTAKLEAQQKVFDATLLFQNQRVDTVKNQVDSLKGVTIIVRERYHEVIKKIDNYTDAELDSFFRQRYKF